MTGRSGSDSSAYHIPVINFPVLAFRCLFRSLCVLCGRGEDKMNRKERKERKEKSASADFQFPISAFYFLLSAFYFLLFPLPSRPLRLIRAAGRLVASLR